MARHPDSCEIYLNGERVLVYPPGYSSHVDAWGNQKAFKGRILYRGDDNSMGERCYEVEFDDEDPQQGTRYWYGFIVSEEPPSPVDTTTAIETLKLIVTELS